MSLSILVVERERHAREGLKEILAADGHDVKVAEDIWAGFASIFSRPYDLLLLDDNVQAERHVRLNVLDLLGHRGLLMTEEAVRVAEALWGGERAGKRRAPLPEVAADG